MRNSEIIETDVILTDYNDSILSANIVNSDAKLSQVSMELKGILFGSLDSFSSSLRGSEVATLKALSFKDYLYSLYSLNDINLSFEDFIKENVALSTRYDALSDTYYVISLIELGDDSSALVLKLGGDGIDEALYFN